MFYYFKLWFEPNCIKSLSDTRMVLNTGMEIYCHTPAPNVWMCNKTIRVLTSCLQLKVETIVKSLQVTSTRLARAHIIHPLEKTNKTLQ